MVSLPLWETKGEWHSDRRQEVDIRAPNPGGMENTMKLLPAVAIAVAVRLLAGTSVTCAQPAPGWRPLVIQKSAPSPTVDGVLTDACWQEADRRPLRHYAGGELTVGGHAALSYDDTTLYAALWLDEPSPERIGTPLPPKGLWDGEVIEWFICPSADGVEYVQLAWNSAGRQFSASCRSTGSGAFTSNAEWLPTWQTVSVVGKGGWTTEAAIPLAELDQKLPADGVMWRINLNRHRVIDPGKPQWSALSPTGTGGFHMIERFEDVHFSTYVETPTTARGDGPLQALIGCWSTRFGYAALFDPHLQLDRALGQDNVQIRVKPPHSSALANWPRRADELARHGVVVLTDVPAASFSEKQLLHLQRYVTEGGALILMGAMGGWKHEPKDGWSLSPLKDMLPLEHTTGGGVEHRRVRATLPEHPLFRGLDLEALGLLAGTQVTKPARGATVLATAGEGPFIAEKTVGKGIVVQITGHYGHKATWVPIDGFGRDFFMSPAYPVFWDNLVAHVTGKAVPHPSKPLPAESGQPGTIVCDIIRDSYGDLFTPGGTIRLRPKLNENGVRGPLPGYPCEIDVAIEMADGKSVSVGRNTLVDAADELCVELPYLDRGRYALVLDVESPGRRLGSARTAFVVALPVMQRDEFSFGITLNHDYLGGPDMTRIARQVKSIGFTSVFWLGSHIYGAYDGKYRMWNRSRNTAIIQAAGLKTEPVWYAPLLDIHHSRKKAGKTDRTSGCRIPDMAFPGKDYLPYAHFWFEAFDRLYGRMPLTDGYYSHDEIVGARSPSTDTDRFKQAFEAMTGHSASAVQDNPSVAYQLLEAKLQVTADLAWLSRVVGAAHAPDMVANCSISPMAMASHSSAVLDLPDTISGLGATAPDVYHYGEPKLYVKSLGCMAILWSATEFGQLSEPSFYGGQLSNAYYEAFPEQVFGAISGGARKFEVFAYGTTSFETNGRQDKRFAEIATRTTADAGRIGRTLNHYSRSRARVAMLYPQTAYMWISLGHDFNDDYLKLVGTSKQYIGLGGAVRAQFDLLRKMFGHVDVLFDKQIQRGDLRNYDVCVVGYARQVQEHTLRELARFAEGGGTLLVSTDSGHRDENNGPTKALYDILPATVGAERSVSADYVNVRMPNPVPFSRGNALVPKSGAELLFTFGDTTPACVRGPVGRGQAILLGMPTAALRGETNGAKRDLIAYVLRKRARLVSRPEDGEFSAITFVPKRGLGRAFMIANHNKESATTRVMARGDVSEIDHALVDIVTGERIPFTVEAGVLSFEVTCEDRWGRALALLPRLPRTIEVSASPPGEEGRKLMLAVRLIGKGSQPVRSTLPFDLVVRDPEGKVRDDLSGVRVAERGVYASAMVWPENARSGTWTVTVSDRISGSSDQATWESQ
jgi:uncharacterized membrane protein